jgi:hypothetical protein
MRTLNSYANFPMSFAENQGQDDQAVKFSATGREYRVFLTEDGATFGLRAGSKAPPAFLQLRLRNANRHPRILGAKKLPSTTNYLVGRDSSKWKKGVSSFGEVKYEEIYPGIDLVYYGKDHRLEYDFIVQPDARPSDIRLALSGSEREQTARIDKEGDLSIRVSGREISFHRPVVYQVGSGGEKVGVSAEYVEARNPEKSSAKGQEFGVQVGNYDRSKPLIIDPVLTFSTFLGGSDIDRANAIAVDTAGNVYVAGSTFSMDFPTVNPIQATRHGSGGDAFVTKINAAGTAIVYSTYLGGSTTTLPSGTAAQAANGIAADSAGNAYVVGQTIATDFPVTAGAFDTSCPTCGANGDVAFVAKLDSTGSQLLYSTYLGGSGGGAATGDRGDAIAVNSSGLAYVTGLATSPDFPTTPGAFKRTLAGGGVFVTQLNADGSALNYSTLIGSGEGLGIALNSAGDAYLAGATGETTYPTTPGAFQPTFGGIGGGGGNDAFITELNSSGSALVYSTYLGGLNEDYAGGIGIDSAGNAYVAGQTFSTNFPVKNAFQPTLNGTADAYVAELNPTGTALVYSTYLGGSNNDDADNVAVDSAGNAYVTGFTVSTDFPLAGALQAKYGGGTMDAFLTVMSPSGTPTFSTYLGGESDDQGNGIAVDSSGNVYVAGQTESSGFPTLNAVQALPGGALDGFVTKFSISTATPPADFSLALSPSSLSVSPGEAGNFSVGLIAIGGFSQAISFSCSVQPAGPTCSMSPATVTPSGLGAAAATATVSTVAPAAILPSGGDRNTIFFASGVRLAVLMGLFIAVLFATRNASGTTRRGAASWTSASILFLFLVLLQACGGGGSGGGGGGGGTKPGTYTVTVTGTSGNLSHSATATVIVN